MRGVKAQGATVGLLSRRAASGDVTAEDPCELADLFYTVSDKPLRVRKNADVGANASARDPGTSAAVLRADVLLRRPYGRGNRRLAGGLGSVLTVLRRSREIYRKLPLLLGYLLASLGLRGIVLLAALLGGRPLLTATAAVTLFGWCDLCLLLAICLHEPVPGALLRGRFRAATSDGAPRESHLERLRPLLCSGAMLLLLWAVPPLLQLFGALDGRMGWESYWMLSALLLQLTLVWRFCRPDRSELAAEWPCLAALAAALVPVLLGVLTPLAALHGGGTIPWVLWIPLTFTPALHWLSLRFCLPALRGGRELLLRLFRSFGERKSAK
jgi:hypothetical protein